jgi:hypothetical protein
MMFNKYLDNRGESIFTAIIGLVQYKARNKNEAELLVNEIPNEIARNMTYNCLQNVFNEAATIRNNAVSTEPWKPYSLVHGIPDADTTNDNKKQANARAIKRKYKSSTFCMIEKPTNETSNGDNPLEHTDRNYK